MVGTVQGEGSRGWYLLTAARLCARVLRICSNDRNIVVCGDRSVPCLTVRHVRSLISIHATEFIDKHPELIPKDNMVDFITKNGGKEYNLCHCRSSSRLGVLLTSTVIDHGCSLEQL